MSHDLDRIGELLSLLPPAPSCWVQAAQELPFARLDEIVARAEADEAFRAALIADLETALQAAGYEPNEALVAQLRGRFGTA